MRSLEEDICVYCGFDNTNENSKEYLPLKTLIAGRYLAGRLKRKNGEGAVYIGYDTSLNSTVWIKEYFPARIAGRNPESLEIRPLPGFGAQYKALMSDFVDICNEVKRLAESDNCIPIENVVIDNNTLYAVYKDIGACSFEEYLARRGGKIPYEEAIKLFVPLMNTVCNLHYKGSIHRGISPYTIYVCDEKLYLWDFALSPARTVGSELESELFNGFSAPEQYSVNGWQGAWTDIYSLAAMIYYSVSGIIPPRSTMISPERTVAKLSSIVKDVPEKISDVIAKAMETDTRTRIKSLTVFISALVTSEESSTAVYEIKSDFQKNSETENMDNRMHRKQGPKNLPNDENKVNSKYLFIALGITVAVLFAFLLFVVSVFFPDLMRKNKEEPPPDSTQGTTPEENDSALEDEENDTAVPVFTGKDIDTILQNEEYKERFEFKVIEEYNDFADKGTVFSQTPSANTPMLNRGTVILHVSRGKCVIKMPDLVGKTYEEALAAVSELESEYEVPLVINKYERYSAGANPGDIVSTTPPADTEFDPQKTDIILYIALESDAGETVEIVKPSSSSSKSNGNNASSKLWPEQDIDKR